MRPRASGSSSTMRTVIFSGAPAGRGFVGVM
jgi:hypothetical protein